MMPIELILQKAMDRAKLILDRPYSLLELRTLGITTTRPTSYVDRVVLREFGPCLRTGNDLVVYDIGANKGTYSVALAKACAVKKIVAFEPIPAVFETLTEQLKEFSHVVCINVALGKEEAESTFYLNSSSASSSLLPMLEEHIRHFPSTSKSTEIKIPIRRLDGLAIEYSLEPPDVIKIDVQGFEDRVIEGGRECFAAARWCLMEICVVPLYEGAKSFDEMYALISGLGFRFAGITDELHGKNGELLAVNVLFERTGKSTRSGRTAGILTNDWS